MNELEALGAEIRKLRRAIERSQQRLVSGTEAAHLLGMHAVTFYRTRPIPPTHVPGEAKPRYSVALIDELIQQWTQEKSA